MERGDSRREFFKRHPDHAEDDILLPATINGNEINMNVECLEQPKLQRGRSFSNIGLKKADQSGQGIEINMNVECLKQPKLQRGRSFSNIGLKKADQSGQGNVECKQQPKLQRRGSFANIGLKKSDQSGQGNEINMNVECKQQPKLQRRGSFANIGLKKADQSGQGNEINMNVECLKQPKLQRGRSFSNFGLKKTDQSGQGNEINMNVECKQQPKLQRRGSFANIGLKKADQSEQGNEINMNVECEKQPKLQRGRSFSNIGLKKADQSGQGNEINMNVECEKQPKLQRRGSFANIGLKKAERSGQGNEINMNVEYLKQPKLQRRGSFANIGLKKADQSGQGDEINMNVECEKQLKLQKRGSFSNTGHKMASRSGQELESDMPRKNPGHLVMQKRGSLPYIGRRENSRERSRRHNHYYQETETSSGNESSSDLYLEKLNAGDLRSQYNPQDMQDDIPPLKLRGNSGYPGPLSFDRSSEHWSLRNARALTNLKARGQDVSARRHGLPVPCPTFEEVRNVSHRDCETATKLESINMKNMLFFPSKSLTRLSVEEIYAPKQRKAPFRRSVSNLCPSRRGMLPRESQIQKEKSSTTSLTQKDTLPGKQSDENVNVPKLMPTIIAKNITEAKFGRVRRQLPTVGPKPFVAAGCGKGIPELSCLPRPRIGRSPMRAIFPTIGGVPVCGEPADSVPTEQEPDIEVKKTGRLVNLNDFHTFDENLKPAFPCTTINIPAIDDLPDNGTRNLGIRKQRSVSEQRTKPIANQAKMMRGKSVTNLFQSRQPQKTFNQQPSTARQPSNYNTRCRNGSQGPTGNSQTKPNTARNPRDMRKMQQKQRFSEDEDEDQPIYDEEFEQEESEDDNYQEVTDEDPQNSEYKTVPQEEILPEIMNLLRNVRARQLEDLKSGRPMNRNPRANPKSPSVEDFYNIVKGPSHDPREQPTVLDAEKVLFMMIRAGQCKVRASIVPDDDKESPEEDNPPEAHVEENEQVKQSPKKAVNFKSSVPSPSNRKQTLTSAPDGDEESPDEVNPPEAHVEENKQVKQTPRKAVNFKSSRPMPSSRKQTVPTIPEETSEAVETEQPIKAPPKIANKPRRVWGELPEVLKKRNDALRTKPGVAESKVKLPVEKEKPKRPKTNPKYAHVQCKVPKLRAPTINEMEAELMRNYEEIEKLKKSIGIIGSEESSNNREESTEDVTDVEHDEEDEPVNVSQEPTETPEIPVELPPVPEHVTEMKDDEIPKGDDSDSDSSSIHTELSYGEDEEEEFSNSILCPWSESNIIDNNTMEEKRFESIEIKDDEDSKQSQRSRKSTKLENTSSSHDFEANREHSSKKPDSSDFAESKTERRPSSGKDTSKRSTTKTDIKAEHEPEILSVKTTSSKKDMRRRDDSKSRDESSIVSSRRTARPEAGEMDDGRSLSQDMSMHSIHGNSTASSYKTAEEEPSTISEYRDALKTTSESTSESDVTLTQENVDQIKARKEKKSASKHHENPPSSSKEPQVQTGNKKTKDGSVSKDGSHKVAKLVNNYLTYYADKFNDNLERTAVHIKYGSTIPCSCDKKATEPCVKHVDRSTLEFYRETVDIMGFYFTPEEDEREYCTAEDLIRQFCPDFYVQYVLENPHHPSESFYSKNTLSRLNVIKSFKRVLLEEDVLRKYKNLKVNIGNRRNIHLKEDDGDFEQAIEFMKEEYPGLYIHLVQANEFLQLAVEKISVNDNRRDLIKKSKMNMEELAELNKKYGTI